MGDGANTFMICVTCVIVSAIISDGLKGFMKDSKDVGKNLGSRNWCALGLDTRARALCLYTDLIWRSSQRARTWRTSGQSRCVRPAGEVCRPEIRDSMRCVRKFFAKKQLSDTCRKQGSGGARTRKTGFRHCRGGTRRTRPAMRLKGAHLPLQALRRVE